MNKIPMHNAVKELEAGFPSLVGPITGFQYATHFNLLRFINPVSTLLELRPNPDILYNIEQNIAVLC